MFRVLVSENGQFFVGDPNTFHSVKAAEKYGMKLADHFKRYSTAHAFAVVGTRLRPDMSYRFSWEMVKANAVSFVDLLKTK